MVIEAFGEFGFDPAAVLVTHGHFDHFGGVSRLAERFAIPVYVGERTPRRLADGGLGPSAASTSTPVRDATLPQGRADARPAHRHTAIPTPGHSPGSVTYVMGDTHLFVGDLFFDGSVGRTDLPGGDMDQLLNSVAALVRRFPPDSLVHRGHGPTRRWAASWP